MAWHAQLDLALRLEAGRSVARHAHTGPLRILQSLYPEGDGICHNVLVHPPGGLVGGDTLRVEIDVGPQAHGLVTTPGATRFYRSDGEAALQQVSARLAAGARLEWLPLETICYDACLAENRLSMSLAPGAELLGWDVTAFGLPASGKPFAQGTFRQHIEVPGLWLERATVKASDQLLLQSPLGMAGHRCIASLFFVTGSKLDRQRRQQALDSARAIIERHALADTAGVTSPDAQVVVLRVLAPVVEPAMHLLRQVWQAWRVEMWKLEASTPRIWST